MKISVFYLDKQKSFIPKKNMKFTKSPGQFFFQPTDGPLGPNFPFHGCSLGTVTIFKNNLVLLNGISIDLKDRGSNIGTQSNSNPDDLKTLLLCLYLPTICFQNPTILHAIYVLTLLINIQCCNLFCNVQCFYMGPKLFLSWIT